MTNLVRLFLDKDTGKIVASGTAVSGEGGGGGGAAASDGYLHIQAIASTLWTINHNVGNDQVLVQVFDNAGNVIVPQRITVDSINTIEVEFGTLFSGRAHIIFFTL